MAKQQRQYPSKFTEKSKFIMKAHINGLSKKNISIDFKPNKKDGLYKQFKDVPLFPVFNFDKKHFTPTFMLRFMQLDSDKSLKKSHDKKVLEYTTEITQQKILIPKPKSKNMYCGVCKDTYEDYYSHINDDQHQFSLRSARFTKHIYELCAKFNNVKPCKFEEETYKQFLHKLKNDDYDWNTFNGYSKQSSRSTKKDNRNTILISSD